MPRSNTNNNHRKRRKYFRKEHEDHANSQRSINWTEISSLGENGDNAVNHPHAEEDKSNKGTLNEL
jgi:hypothetical protein